MRSCNKGGKAAGGGADQHSPPSASMRNRGDGPGLPLTPNKQPRRPKTLVCYICGREYGTTSLEIHLKSCKQKWEQAEALKPKHERRPLPQAPQNFDDIIAGRIERTEMDNYNDAAFKNYNEKALMPCPNCARTFLPERLDIHLRSCNKAHGKAAGEEIAGGSAYGSPGVGGGGSGRAMGTPQMKKVPKTLICYICGREYGTSSLEIHLKSCKKKWEQEESKKPPKERRPLPEPPKNFDEIIVGAKSMTSNQLEEFRNEAFNEYNTKGLVKCDNCGRTFLPDRLEIHLRSCNKAHAKTLAMAGSSSFPEIKH